MKREMIWLGLFNFLYISIFTVYYILAGNFEFLFYIFILIIIGCAVFFTLKTTKLNSFALWGLSIWGLLHMLGGGLLIGGRRLYGLHVISIIDKGGQFFILKMDQVIHFYGFFITAVVVYQILSPYISARNKKRKMFLSWIGSMGLGALNEAVEFIIFVSLPETGVGDVYNTGLDLIFNLLGAFFGALTASSFDKNRAST